MNPSMMYKEEAQELYKNYDNNNTPLFGLNGWCGYARVVDVYDGDTVILIIKHFYTVYKVQARLQGIDTPEIKSKNQIIKLKALEARNALINFVTGGKIQLDIKGIYTRPQIQSMFTQEVYLVWVCIGEADKYGRVLTDLYLEECSDQQKCASNFLIQKGYAYAYDGGRKLSEVEQIDKLNKSP